MISYLKLKIRGGYPPPIKCMLNTFFKIGILGLAEILWFLP